MGAVRLVAAAVDVESIVKLIFASSVYPARGKRADRLRARLFRPAHPAEGSGGKTAERDEEAARRTDGVEGRVVIDGVNMPRNQPTSLLSAAAAADIGER